jgi:phenylacetate-CoA ligase
MQLLSSSLGNAGFEPGDLKGWPDLARLPVLSKSDVATHVEDLIADNSNRAILIPRKTSGSTGVSLHFFSDDAEFQFKRAVAIYRDQWAGWRLGEWKACVWGNPLISIAAYPAEKYLAGARFRSIRFV